MNVNNITVGMRVKTNSQLEDTQGMFVAPRYMAAREPNKEGTTHNAVGGHGGEVWWIKHDDNTVASYANSEFEPVPVAPAETETKVQRPTLDELLDLDDDASRPILQR